MWNVFIRKVFRGSLGLVGRRIAGGQRRRAQPREAAQGCQFGWRRAGGT